MADSAPIGRPTKYRPEYDELAFKFCLLGATNDRLAEMFEVDPSTIDLWIATHESFSGSVKKGRVQADAEIAHSLYHRGKGYSHPDVHISNFQGEITKTDITKHYPPDTAAAFIWLKNRANWKDKQELTGADGKDLIPDISNPETLKDVARRLAFVLSGATEK
jgi:hypothetical protein